MQRVSCSVEMGEERCLPSMKPHEMHVNIKGITVLLENENSFRCVIELVVPIKVHCFIFLSTRNINK